MAEIDDRNDVAPLDLGESHVGEGPVIAARADEGLVERRAVAQDLDVELVEQVEIRPPVLVMAALLHLVDAGAAIVDGRDAVLDPGREHEGGEHRALPLRALAGRSKRTRQDASASI